MSETQPNIDALLATADGRSDGVIIVHNTPDPDALGAAQALRALLATRGVESVICYQGPVYRANNQEMVRLLNIDAQRYDKRILGSRKLLATVDCQPGAGNNPLPRTCEPTIVIDHHPKRKHVKAEFCDIRPEYGSTSTIMTEYIRAAGLKISRTLATSLFYGIRTDTIGTGRNGTPHDAEAMSWLFGQIDMVKLAKIENPRLSRYAYRIGVRAVQSAEIYKDVLIAVLPPVESTDVVAEMADYLVRLQDIRWCAVLSEKEGRLYISLRRGAGTMEAYSILKKLIGRKGSAGGHSGMAAAQMPMKDMKHSEAQVFIQTCVSRLLELLKVGHVKPVRLVDNQPAAPGTTT